MPDPTIEFDDVTWPETPDGPIQPAGWDLDDGVPRHAIVAIIVARDGIFWPDAPEGFQFFDAAVAGNELEPVYELNLQQVGTFATDAGDRALYAYLYIVPQGFTTDLYVYPREGVQGTYQTVAALSVTGLVELGPVVVTVADTPDTTVTIPEAAGGEVDLNGQWILAAHPGGDRESGDFTDVTWPATREGVNPEILDVSAGQPGFIFGGIGETPGTGDLDFVFETPGAVHATWLQLLPMPIPSVIEPDTTVVTNTFEGITGGLVGATYSMPLATATNEFDADLVMPSASTEWRAVLVDAAGTAIHRMPDITLGDIVETLNDVTHARATIPLRSPAASAIEEADQTAALEVQIWRGPVLWMWGPVIDADPDDDRLVLTIHDAPWHLTQRHVGAMGNRFGGRPPYYHDPMVNLRFETGDTTGWSMLRTVTIGTFPGFDTVPAGAITVDPTRRLPSGEPAVRADAGGDPLDNLQLYQDLTVRTPQNGRALHMVFSGWWYLPSDGGFAPNNQRMGLLIAPLIEDPSLPVDYYRPADVGFTILDETSPRDVWFYQQCELDLPVDADPREIHVSVCFPQGISYVAGLDVQVDDGLLYDESPTTIGAGLVMHAQDPAFDRDDVNLDWWANTIGDREVREYIFADHTNVMGAISALAREGWFDWWCSYVAGARVMNFLARRRGAYRPKARIRARDGGPSNVATVARKRTTGATSIAVQTRTRDRGNHEHAATVDGALTLEDVIVAEREPSDYDLPAIARERVRLTARPETFTVDTLSGDERFLLGLQVGDTTDITSDVPGALAAGRWRLTQRTTSPTRDACTLTFNPEPT